MANIAGYRVVEAARVFGRFFTGQVTAAGKVSPAKVLVAGAGVAGLAAIGAAGSLGAVVPATDPRPEVADQVRSLGGDYLSVRAEDEVAEASATGYGKEMGADYQAREAALYAEQAADVDIIITTALIPGRPAPRLITAEMVASMRPGSVIVDMAAADGGNVVGTVKDQAIVTDNRVTIIGYTDLAGRLATQASQLYVTNLVNLMKLMTPGKDGVIVPDFDDVVQRSMTVVRDGELPSRPRPAQCRRRPSGTRTRGQHRSMDNLRKARSLARSTGGSDPTSSCSVPGAAPPCPPTTTGPAGTARTRGCEGVPAENPIPRRPP